MLPRIRRHVRSLPKSGSVTAPASHSYPSFRWRDGNSSLEFLALGEVANGGSSGGFRHGEALRSIDVEQLASDDDAALAGSGLPLAIHAVRFSGRRASDERSPWRGWPNGRSWVPRWLMVRTPDGRRFEITHEAEPPPASNATATAQPPLEPRRLEHARDAFVALVGQARAAIEAGILRKVVVARSETVTTATSFDASAQFEALARFSPAAIAFSWERSPGSAFLGATPEVLARVEGGVLTTSAIAGTALAAVDPKGEALLHDEKIRLEHALVVEAMRSALQELVTELRVDEQPRVLRSERLVHLETPMRGVLGELGLLDVCASLHPTPALGGSPREAALAWLGKHYTFKEGYQLN